MLAYNPRTKFILAVGQSGLSFNDMACISTINPVTLMKFCAGRTRLYENELQTLAAILGRDPTELFGPDDVKNGVL